jgi:hypothetical protein
MRATAIAPSPMAALLEDERFAAIASRAITEVFQRVRSGQR